MTEFRSFDPMSSYFEQHPYEEFKRMRDHCRAYRHEDTLMPVVSFFHDSDIRTMLQDWETWSSQRSEDYNKKALGDAALLIGSDPPYHTKYRDIVAPLFMPGKMKKWSGVIEQFVTESLDQNLGAGEINFVEDIAADVTVKTICEVAGVPKSDGPLVRKMTIDLAYEDGRPVFWKKPDPETEARVGNVMSELTAYFTEHFKKRDPYKHDDLLSLIGREVKERRELIGLCILIVAAGNETTTNLITHTLQELNRHPEQMQIIRDDPDGNMNGLIEEILRYRGTIRKQDRYSRIDTVIDGVEIRKGDPIALWNGSASRDPAVVDRPDEFDITRHPNRHLAFGSGIHMCIGNALARVEMRVLFKHLLERTREIPETRGADSYESLKNGVLDAAKRYSVELIAA
jgi:cytochrome P450